MRVMQRLTFVGIAAMLMTLTSSAASAQDDRRFGIVMAYPASVGVEWQAASNIAFRLDGDYSRLRNEATSEFEFARIVPGLSAANRESVRVTTIVRSRDLSLGFSVLVDLHRSDELRVYVAPRLGVSFVNTAYETEIDGDPASLAALTVPANNDTSSTSPAGGVALGASHDVSGRLRVFGETGFSYARRNFTAGVSSDTRTSSFGLRAGVGVVILF
jgi:opacity protein-like surface antigen